MTLSKLPGIYINVFGKYYKKPPTEDVKLALTPLSDGLGNVSLHISPGFTLTAVNKGNGEIELLTTGCTLTSVHSKKNVKLGVK